MAAKRCSAFLLVVFLTMVAAFGSSDEKFLKKYAMMKIYESCFGADVVKDIRKEMKAACAKCAAPPEEPAPPQNSPQQAGGAIFVGRLPPSVAYPLNNNLPTYTRLGEPSQDANQNNELAQQYTPQGMQPVMQEQQGIDTEKLQQAIMGFRQPLPGFPQPNFGFRAGVPFGGQPLYQPLPSPYFQPWPQQPYQAPYQQQFYQQQFPYFGQRMSRDMDFRGRLEMLTSRSSGKVRNVTCVMQELGYLDENLEPNYNKIAERIANLPVSTELKNDIQDGLSFCQQFAQCVPETKKENSPLSRELIKPMFFFRCYKHKKLEACVMKDVRDRFTSEEDLETETDFRSMSRVGRVMKHSTSMPEEGDDLATSMYDFLYGGSDLDLESML